MVRGQTPHKGARTRRDLRPAVEPMRGGALERDGDVRVWGVGGEALKLGPEHDPRVSTLHANALDVGLARDHEVEKEARVDLGAQRGGHVEVGEHWLQALDAPGMHLLDDVPDVEEVAQTAGGRGVAAARHVGWGVGLGVQGERGTCASRCGCGGERHTLKNFKKNSQKKVQALPGGGCT